MSSSEKRLLFILACINFTHIMDFMIMMPMGPLLMQIFSVSPREYAFIVSAYSLSAGISGFLAAFFVDKYDRKQVLLIAYTGFLIGNLACGLAPNYGLLMAARIVAGIFGGVIGSQVLSMVADTFPFERRATAMGVIMTAFSAASVVGIPVGLFLSTRLGWHAPFLSIFGLGLVVWVLLYLYIPSMTKHLKNQEAKQNPLSVLTNIWHNPNQLRALMLTTIIMLGHFSIIPFISPYLVHNVGFGQNNIFLIYLVGGLCTIVTAPLVGRWADKIGKLPVFVTFALLSSIPIFLITNLWVAPMWVILLVAALFFIFTNGRLIPVQAITSSVVSSQNRGSFMSINSSVQLLAQALASNIGGFIIGKDAEGHLTHYSWVGFFAIFMIISSIFVARTIKQEG